MVDISAFGVVADCFVVEASFSQSLVSGSGSFGGWNPVPLGLTDKTEKRGETIQIPRERLAPLVYMRHTRRTMNKAFDYFPKRDGRRTRPDRVAKS